MTSKEIEALLFAEQDIGYGDFQAKLMPNVPREQIIGVRTPILRKLAKTLAKTEDVSAFLRELPHPYYDETNLHGFLISEEKDYARAVEAVDALLPYVDNWATCDLLSPKAFRRHRDRLPEDIERWLSSDHPFTVRFGIEMIQSHFLDAECDARFLARVAEIKSEEYYVNMMIAWFFATALTKQWDAALPYLAERRLTPWVHRKTIQKAIESHAIPAERKALLQSMK